MSQSEALTSWQTYKRLLAYTAQYWPAFMLSIIGNLIFAASQGVSVEFLKYIIDAIGGTLFCKKNIEKCNKKQKEIDLELSNMFKNAQRVDDKGKHSADKSGKSTFSHINFWFISGYWILFCWFNNIKSFIISFENSRRTFF